MARRNHAACAIVPMLSLGGYVMGGDVVSLAPLHIIATENHSTQPIPRDAPVRVRLHSSDSQALAKVLGVTVSGTQTSFDYLIDKYPQLGGPATRTWLEPTFVIDFTEPEFDQLRQELGARGARITRPQVVEYVASLIDESNDRGWDLASVVARRRQGDCSEHAVLTTALARQQGIPSRVVVGVVLVADGSNYGAFGHAWSEMVEDGQWSVADAALFELQAAVRYVPITLMENEGLGYAMSLMGVLQMWIDRVVVLGP
jgi:hypothetical protein